MKATWSKDKEDAYFIVSDLMRTFKRMSKGWALLNHARQHIRDREDFVLVSADTSAIEVRAMYEAGAQVHPIGCICETCSATYEKERQ